MATKFILNDFVTDDIPECLLSNSRIVKKLIKENIPITGEIQDINLVGVMYRGLLIHEWQVLVKIEDTTIPLPPLPVFLPRDIELAAALIEIHISANQKETQRYTYKANDYLTVGGKYPCQLVLGEDGELYLKRITMFASQVQVQEFLQQTLQQELVTAALVIINKHNFCYKGLQDIGWLVNLDGYLSLMSMDRRIIDNSLTFIDNFEELPIDTIFELDGQKYIVTEDEDNGEFIAKVTSRQAREYKQALKMKTNGTIH